jgi:hypothetical protein
MTRRLVTGLGIVLAAGVWVAMSPAVSARSFQASNAASPARTSPSPTPAPPTFALTPTSGPIGTILTLSGSGFPPGAFVFVRLDSGEGAITQFLTDSKGGFKGVITNVFYTGTYNFCAENTVVACAQFKVTPAVPTVTLDPASGPADIDVKVKGREFPPGELVAMYLDVPAVILGTPGPFADPIGGFVTTVRLGGAGAHQVCGDTGPPFSGSQTYIVKACAEFTFTVVNVPSPTPSPSALPTLRPTPAAAHVSGGQPPIWPLAGAAALLVAGGAGVIVWRRRRMRIAPEPEPSD